MLLGEYGVIEGGPAVVAAVNRRAWGHALTRPVRSGSPVVRAVLDCAAQAGHEVPPGINIDTTTFRDAHGTKLGLGSSSVVAVITASLATGRADAETLKIAVQGHRDAAGGRGSGVDVAACFYGGVIVAPRQPGPVEQLAQRVQGLEMAVLYTGDAASTPELVKGCKASPRWSHWASLLQGLTLKGIDAWNAQDGLRWLSIVSDYGQAMAGMGRDAGVAVVTEQIDGVMRLAQESGAAAKPSGAGGGDVVVMWGKDRETAARIAEQTECELVDLQVDPHGLDCGPGPSLVDP